jgi:hypothetical protein
LFAYLSQKQQGKFGIATLKGDLKVAYVSGKFGKNEVIIIIIRGFCVVVEIGQIIENVSICRVNLVDFFVMVLIVLLQHGHLMFVEV